MPKRKTPPKRDTKKTGTREWSSHSYNCCAGCSNACVYCYARRIAVTRRGMKPEDWSTEMVLPAQVARAGKTFAGGTVMFPTTHDITIGNLDACIEVLWKLARDGGNKILVVSKPKRACIRAIISALPAHREQIEFRFSIGGLSEPIRAFWEPGAPSFAERIECLRLAHQAGWKTSVSCEPLLEPCHVGELVATVYPFASEIWIGTMNKIRARTGWLLAPTHPRIVELEQWQTATQVQYIAEQLAGYDKIRWKDSYRRILNLAQSPQLNRKGSIT